jgi:hypothetical protein
MADDCNASKITGVDRRSGDELEAKFGDWFMEVVERTVLQPHEVRRARRSE